MTTTYKLQPKEIRKIKITVDTADIVAALLECGKYTVPSSLENEMYALFNKFDVFYTTVRYGD